MMAEEALSPAPWKTEARESASRCRSKAYGQAKGREPGQCRAPTLCWPLSTAVSLSLLIPSSLQVPYFHFTGEKIVSQRGKEESGREPHLPSLLGRSERLPTLGSMGWEGDK